VVIAVEAFKVDTVTQFEDDWRWLLTTALAIGACNDVIVAAFLCFYTKPKLASCDRYAELAILFLWKATVIQYQSLGFRDADIGVGDGCGASCNRSRYCCLYAFQKTASLLGTTVKHLEVNVDYFSISQRHFRGCSCLRMLLFLFFDDRDQD